MNTIVSGVIAWVLVLFTAPALVAAELPESLRPYAELCRKAAEYQEGVWSGQWREVMVEEFDTARRRGWTQMAPPVGAELADLELIKHEGRSVLSFKMKEHGQGLLQIGPKMRGEFAVEVVAKTVSEMLCDMSILTDRVGGPGPGFQFGGWVNSRNTLWAGPEAKGEDGTQKMRTQEVGQGVQIQRDKWHTVRMEVRRNHVLGYVDGKLLGQVQLAPEYNHKAEYQPLFYLYASTVLIDRATIYAWGGDAVAAAPEVVWKRVYGEQSRQEVARQLGELVDRLGDDSFAVRSEAETLLLQAGLLAVEPLKAATRSDDPETMLRAEGLLQRLAPAIEADRARREQPRPQQPAGP